MAVSEAQQVQLANMSTTSVFLSRLCVIVHGCKQLLLNTTMCHACQQLLSAFVGVQRT